jgi:hypothetical protein
MSILHSLFFLQYIEPERFQMPTDPLHSKPLYPSSNGYGIPDLPHVPLSATPNWIVPYRTRVPATHQYAVHFFIYDALFESVWQCPEKTRPYLERYQVALSPDFSLNADQPLSVQLWNTYRNRWCAAHWTATLGLTVIPTVSWAKAESYGFCFLGLPKNSVLALTTLGTRTTPDDFLQGWRVMLARLQPSLVLCYGLPYPEMLETSLQIYPDQYSFRKKRLKVEPSLTTREAVGHGG